MKRGSSQKGMETTLSMNFVWNLGFCMETEFMNGFYEIMYEFPCFDGYPLAQI